jgi:replicative DNA helicase
MDRGSLHRRLISMTCSLNHNDLIRGELSKDQRASVLSKFSEIGKCPLAIIDDYNKFHEIMADVAHTKPDFVVIDYLGLIETRGRFENRNQEVSYVSRQLKLCASEQHIPILALSQLSRASDIDNRRPRLSDLRESGSIEQDADVVLFLHQPSTLKRGGGDAPRDQVQLWIEKQRNGARDLCVYLTMQGHFSRMVEMTNIREEPRATNDQGRLL